MEKDKKRSGAVVTAGSFDGVHRGHLLVVDTLRRYAEAHGLRAVAVTFDRHPLEVVCPERAPLLLQSREERDRMLREAGAEVEEVVFDKALCSLTAREWMEELKRRFGAEAVVLGYDNTFGRDGRTMSHKDYEALGREVGLQVVRAPELPGVCSSAIRKALERGDVKVANEMLGREYEVEGRVVEGRKLGRQLGFPTANLEIDPRRQLPASGVYAARLDGMPAVVNIGTNPTVGPGNPRTVEAHLIDFSGDLYGRKMKLRFVAHLRPEHRFDSLDALRTQIAFDKQAAKKILFK